MFLTDSERQIRIAANRFTEIPELLNRAVFDVVTIEDAKTHRFYEARFVDENQSDGTLQEFEKSRIAIQGSGD